MTLLHVCVFCCGKINVPLTGVVCLSFCYTGSPCPPHPTPVGGDVSSSYLTPPFPSPWVTLCFGARYMDINEPGCCSGVQQEEFSLVVNLLYGNFLPLASVVKSCGGRILKQALRCQDWGYETHPLSGCRSSFRHWPSSSGARPLLVFVNKPYWPASAHRSPLTANEGASRQTAASLQVGLLSLAFK